MDMNLQKIKEIFSNPQKIVKWFLIGFVILLLFIGVYLVYDNFFVNDVNDALNKLNKEDRKILKQLKKIILLPEDIIPQMAVVTDAEALRNTEGGFFKDAQNGFRVILYPEMAILYDYDNNKIIKVGVLQINRTDKIKTFKFAIYNSTQDVIKLDEMEKKLTSIFNNVEVVVKEKAAKKNYAKTLVIDLIGDNQEMEKIAKLLNAEVSALPEGEKMLEGVDILVIIGKE